MKLIMSLQTPTPEWYFLLLQDDLRAYDLPVSPALPASAVTDLWERTEELDRWPRQELWQVLRQGHLRLLGSSLPSAQLVVATEDVTAGSGDGSGGVRTRHGKHFGTHIPTAACPCGQGCLVRLVCDSCH
jgi:hypothetical protein